MDTLAAISLTRELMNQHGLHNVAIDFSHGKNQMGYCRLKKRIINGIWNGEIYPDKICLSKYLIAMNGEEQVKDTILHEVSHALKAIRSRPFCYGRHHDQQFKMIAKSIGCKSLGAHSCQAESVKGRIEGKCPGCGKMYYKHRMGRRIRYGIYTCRVCGGKFQFYDTADYVPRQTQLAATGT